MISEKTRRILKEKSSVNVKAISITNSNNDLCYYGCGNVAKFEFKNGHKCCSDLLALCPSIRLKNSKSLKKRGNMPRFFNKYTERTYRKYKHIINSENKKRGHRIIDHQLDHKYSVIEGFQNGIDPKIIGSLPNLEMLPARINNQKKRKCSITLISLLEQYEELCEK
jgi:hypothetical protein